MLHDLQKAFLKRFYQKEMQNFLQYVRSNQYMSSQERFEIYADSITEGLIRALRESFPVTEKLVGEDFFRGMSHQFIEKTPSISPNLNDYGILFADFVSSFPYARDLPYLADVSRLEWAWQQAYYGTHYRSMDIETLKQMEPEHHQSLIFKRAVNSSLLKSSYPIKDIWLVNQDNYEEDGVIHLVEDYEIRLLIWRPAMEVILDELTEVQWLIVKIFDEGMTLGQMLEHPPFQDKIDLNHEISQMVLRGWFEEMVF